MVRIRKSYEITNKTNHGNSCCHCWNFKPWRVCWEAKRTDETNKSHQASSAKEDKEAIKQKQLAYLKEHEQMTAYVAHNANFHQVSYDWDSIKTVVGGNEHLREVTKYY